MARTSLASIVAAIITLTRIGETCVVRFAPRLQGSNHPSITEDTQLATVDFVRWHGYPVEEHMVTSNDGYVTTLHRLPYSAKSPNKVGRPPVLLYHCLLCSGDVWIMSGPENALGFQLVDSGYDVWLANTRGNLYSRKHLTLSPELPQFWNFSFHEMGYYDAPANIDYILAKTGQDQLHYIGHSLGATIFFVMTTLRPEYNSKIRLMIALAPGIFFGHPKHPYFGILSLFHDTIIEIYKSTETFEILPFNTLISSSAIQFCSLHPLTRTMCEAVLLPAAGLSYQQFNTTITSSILGHFPGGTSVKTLEHLFQLAITGKFSEYNHPAFGKLQLYRNSNTQDYNLSMATAPIAIYFSEKDTLVASNGVLQLSQAIPNLVENFRIPEETFGHTDFVFGKNAKSLLYNSVLKFMKKY